MHVIHLRTRVDEKVIKNAVGRRAKPADFSVLLTGGSATVYKSNGERLLTVLREALSTESTDLAYPFLHDLKKHTTQNRGAYSGEPRFHKIKKDGTRSNTNSAIPVRSVVLGSIDRSPRYPFCNQLPVVSRDPEGWKTCMPMAKEIAKAFAHHVPDRYAAQMEIVKRTDKAYVIPETPFTTLTVNNTVSGGYHADAGDYKPGFGVMAVLRRGTYRGCDLVVPAFGVAVDLRDRDLLLFDVHEIHGNTPFEDAVGDPADPEGHERISIVCYFRERMTECLPPNEERERAKTVHGSLEEVDA